MMQFENIVFWCYILLLLGGGLFGFFKARSKVSLITSVIAAVLLILARIGILDPSIGRKLTDIILLALLVVFAIRLTKTKKFMPSGLMLALTAVVLALLNIRHNW
jgi:uncharacterized membrane protein (UPF0136 family)